MDEKRGDATAVADGRQERRRGDRRRNGTSPGRFSTAPATRLHGQLRCERNDVGEIVEIWIGGSELLRTVIDCSDRRENPYFSITIHCS